MSGEDCLVRPITGADAGSFGATVDSVARERRWLMAVEGFPAEATCEFVRHNVARGHPHWVAVHGASVVGWCDIVPWSGFPGFGHNGRLGLGVLHQYRRAGLGGRLLASALAAARQGPFRRIELEVFADNTAARSLYRRFGFREEGVKRRARILDGKTQDLVCLALWLDGGAGS